VHSVYTPIDEEPLEAIRQAGGGYVLWRPVGGIGDAIMMLPAITALKRETEEIIAVVCVDYIAPVIERNKYVDYVLPYDGEEISKGIDQRAMGLLYDLGAVLLRYYNPCPAATYEAATCPDIYKPRQDIFCDFADVSFDIDNYCFEVEDEDNTILDELPERYIVAQLRSHDKWRDYPYIKLLLWYLVKLGKALDFTVITVDSTKKYDVKGVVSYTQTRLGYIFAIIKHSLMFVGMDSMGVHAAGALRVPSLGIFGPTDPKVRLRYYNAHWMPRFKRCRRQYCWYLPCKWRFCLRALSAKRVANQTEQIIKGAV